MANKRQNDNTIKRNSKRATALDTLASRILKTIDSSYDDRRLINTQNSKFQEVIDRQFNIAKGVSNGQIVDFIAQLRLNDRTNINPDGNRLDVDAFDLFTQNIGDIFGYFQDIYKNRYIEVSDLKFISKFIPSIGEAVKTTLDSIVTSDDVSESITRNLVLDGVTDKSIIDPIISEITRIEADEKLLKKLKNIAYKKTLITGSYYVYAIGYSELFELYSRGLASGKITRKDQSMNNADNVKVRYYSTDKKTPKGGNTDKDPLGLGKKVTETASYVFDASTEPALEGFDINTKYAAESGLIRKCEYTQAMEAIYTNIKDSVPKVSSIESIHSTVSKVGSTEIINSIKESLPSIYFFDSSIPLDCLSDVSMIVQEGYDEVFGKKASAGLADADKALNEISDGTFNINDEGKRVKGDEFPVNGTYLKWIDYKYIIPIEIFNRVVGYYHITSTKKANGNTGSTGNGSILSNSTMQLFSQVNMTEQKKEEAIQSIVGAISSAILDQFGTKFVRKNDAFKDLIADCIIANGLVNNDYMIQFIPAENIVEFKINEDENGHGESILADSLFPGHLLLSLLVCKELNYINKSGNRTIAHISKGPIDESNTNQIQRVIRNLQESNVTFNDLLSTNLVFSKFSRDSNIAMPKDRNGNRLVEFEVQEGQQIELNTEFENKLEQMAIMGTGVPPVILEYIGNVDVAKEIVSANIKFAGRVSNLQSDLEEPTTLLYKKILKNSNLKDEYKKIVETSFKFKLPRPKILANANNADSLQTLQSMASTAADIIIGQANNKEEAARLKDILIRKIVEEESPFFDWPKIRKFYEEAQIEINKETVDDLKPTDTSMGGSDISMNDNSMGDMGEF